MKNVKNITILFLGLLLSGLAHAQDTNGLILVREDHVAPSLTDQYEAGLSRMKAYLESHTDYQFNYFTHMQDDYTFTQVMPMEDYNEYLKMNQDLLGMKVDDNEFTLALEQKNSATVSYKYYLVNYRPELSHVPEGNEWIAETSYRKWSFFHFYPGTEDDVEIILKSWKGLYDSNNIEFGYRVFEGMIGIDRPVYLLTTWSKSPLDYHKELEAASAALGDQGAALWQKMMENVHEVKVVEGWYMPQYSNAEGMTFGN